jgi:hypothetical protein
LTEEGAKQILDEVTIALDVPERFLRVERQLPMGVNVMPAYDQATKLHSLRLNQDWLSRTDEGAFRFAAAYAVLLSERTMAFGQSLTPKLLALISSTPVIAAIFAGGSLPGWFPYAAVGFMLLGLGLSCYLMWRMMRKDVTTTVYERALRISGDYLAAQRYLKDQLEWAGGPAVLRARPKQVARQLAHLEAAAKKVGLLADQTP